MYSRNLDSDRANTFYCPNKLRLILILSRYAAKKLGEDYDSVLGGPLSGATLQDSCMFETVLGAYARLLCTSEEICR